ncbi:hypothetical protein F511_43509 [Dorcoceras hygrometricum]|uniref:Uncharacterized protein n=1 Tax=Dorcoceras hygrometricum TaxID=472368 RepID=A0A2Z7CYV8_9LAMI|nr:hypothetical protein F511_43509 [Dorcoceras hygrometricum]
MIRMEDVFIVDSLLECRYEARHLLMGETDDRHDVRLAEPVDYRSVVNKALRAEQDWKIIEEE